MEDHGGEGSAEEARSQPAERRRRLTRSNVSARLWTLVDALTGADNDPNMFKFAVEPTDRESQRLDDRTDAIVRERSGHRGWRAIILFGTAGIPLLFLFAVVEWEGDSLILSRWDWRLGSCLIFAEVFLLVLLLFVRARVASLGAQLVILQYEKVLTTFEKDHEKRAADLFFKHQAELKQYYDQTLRQNRQSFIVGILCIAFGLSAIIAVATLLLDSESSTMSAKLAAGGFGILAVLLTGFIARIYLQVYQGSAEALGSFHERLVNTNDYHFAGLLISMIEPQDKRMEAQSQLAAAISGRHGAGGG